LLAMASSACRTGPTASRTGSWARQSTANSAFSSDRPLGRSRSAG
jgi:hypothetical protein